MHWLRPSCRCLATLLFLILVTDVVAAEASEQDSKVLIGKRFLFAQPNASAPAPLLLEGLDGQILEEYEAFTLARVGEASLDALRQRAAGPGVEVRFTQKYDKIFVNGFAIDARFGTSRSLPDPRLDPPYGAGETGAWIVQFIGPIRDVWIQQIASERVTPIQYIPYNAYIVVASSTAAERVRHLPFVQFIDQFHSVLKPSVSTAGGKPLELWIHLARTEQTESALELLEKLANGGIRADPWSSDELRVEGVFTPDDVETILREPLVIAVTHRPTIAASDERAALSLTNVAPSGSASGVSGRYKKWLADTCDFCGNLAGERYYIGIADLGLDGGSHLAEAQSNTGEPSPASGLHRPDLPPIADCVRKQFRGHQWNLVPGKQ